MPRAIEVLADKISFREKLIKKIVIFCEDLVQKYGVVTLYTQGSSHTHVVKELRDFHGFVFITDQGQTMFGGNNVEIFYGGQSVINIRYQTFGSPYMVEWWEQPDKIWLQALGRIMMAPRKAVKDVHMKIKREKRKTDAQRREEEKLMKLNARAKELGL